MVSTQAFAAINAEQLVTRTDRLLFGTLRRYEPKQLARGTQRIVVEEPTQVVRFARMSSVSTERASVVLLCAAAALAWLAVAVICLLA